MSREAELKSTGLKATFPRLKILDIFCKSNERHLSAEDVYKALLNEKVEIGLATVYRVLTQLEQVSILSRSQFDGGKSIFELNSGSHDHLVCTSCGNVIEFVDLKIKKQQEKIAKNYNFSLENYKMILYGKCCECNSLNTILE